MAELSLKLRTVEDVEARRRLVVNELNMYFKFLPMQVQKLGVVKDHHQRYMAMVEDRYETTKYHIRNNTLPFESDGRQRGGVPDASNTKNQNKSSVEGAGQRLNTQGQ